MIAGLLRWTWAHAGLVFLLSACTFASAGTPTATPPPAPPTATPVPLAARVNGEGIALADYLSEIGRFQQAHSALGTDLATMGDYQAQVLQSLVDQELLSQGARASGLTVTDAELQARMGELAADAGGVEALGAWLAENDYSAESFQSAVAEEMQAQAMVENIASQVGESADQVHARHLLVSSREQAEALRQQILAGEEFALLARQFTLDLTTRPAGGDLGWFPRGVLLTPEVEAAAFALAPGDVSPVVESILGFHVVETIERGEHPLSPSAAVRLRELAVVDWLSAQRESAVIEILVAP
ncbi:MAG: peptidylprolyl isomerase [Anaerolineales bacterium]